MIHLPAVPPDADSNASALHSWSDTGSKIVKLVEKGEAIGSRIQKLVEENFSKHREIIKEISLNTAPFIGAYTIQQGLNYFTSSPNIKILTGMTYTIAGVFTFLRSPTLLATPLNSTSPNPTPSNRKSLSLNQSKQTENKIHYMLALWFFSFLTTTWGMLNVIEGCKLHRKKYNS